MKTINKGDVFTRWTALWETMDRKGNIAIAKQSFPHGSVRWSVWIVQKVKNGFYGDGSLNEQPPAESAYGKTAWQFISEDLAHDLFTNLTNNQT